MDSKPKILTFTSQVLELFCNPSIVEGITGDLEESYYENKTRIGAFRTNLIHIIQVAGFIRPKFRKRTKYSNTKAMLKNYF
ncbi:MAG: permease prefix domain 2-containing transporter [Bacteroidota bacterium]